MKTVSYSLDEETANGIKMLAEKSKMSSSDIVRSMYTRMHLDNTFDEMELRVAPLLEKLGLNSEDEIAVYAKSKN